MTSDAPKPPEAQRCALTSVWFTWLATPGIALLVGLSTHWILAGFVLAVGVVAQVLYVRNFPRLSKAIGYGSVADSPASAALPTTKPLDVTLFTANVCPFCPLMRRRLQALQSRMGFELHEVDLTFRPQLAMEKRIRSVPVVEANGRVLIGNATSADLADFLRDSADGSRAALPGATVHVRPYGPLHAGP